MLTNPIGNTGDPQRPTKPPPSPIVEPDSGTYQSPITVRMAPTAGGVATKYALNDDDLGQIYTKPFQLQSNVRQEIGVSAWRVRHIDQAESDVISRKYILLPSVEPHPSPTVAAPTFSPGDGATATNLVFVTLATTTPDARIFYTIDDGAPTEQSTPYIPGHLIAVTSGLDSRSPANQAIRTINRTIKARAFKGGAASAVATATYTINVVYTQARDKCFLYSSIPFYPESYQPSNEVAAALLPDLKFAEKVPPSKTDANGNINANVRVVVSGQKIQDTLSLLQPGEAAYIEAGIYPENIVSVRNGTVDNPIWIIAEPEAVLQPPAPLLDVNGEKILKSGVHIQHDYWIVQGTTNKAGLKINGGDTEGNAVTVEGDYVTIKDIVTYDGTASEAVEFVNATHAALLDSTIRNYKPRPNTQDAHAILVFYNSERILIQGNNCYDNDGDGIQCQGPRDNSIPGTGGIPLDAGDPKHITIVGNDFYRNVENAVDLKSCTAVTVRGNKLHDYGAAGSRSGKGTALVIHYNADGVLVEDNDIWHCGQAASVGNKDHPHVGAVVFRRNLIHDMTVLTDANGTIDDTGAGLIISTTKRVEIYNNTFFKLPRGSGTRNDRMVLVTSGYAVRFDLNGGPIGQATFINNIVMDVGIGVIAERLNEPLSCDRNLYFSSTSNPTGTAHRPIFQIGNTATDWADWRKVYDCTSPDPASAPLFTNAAGGDFRISAASPARNQAIPVIIDGVVEDFEGTRPDIGAIEFVDSAHSLRARLSPPGKRIAVMATVATAVIAAVMGVTIYLKKRKAAESSHSNNDDMGI